MEKIMNCKLITVCSDLSRTGILTNSAVCNGFSFVKIKCEWRGYGTKLLEVRQHLLDNPDVTHFFFADAYDVVVLSSLDEALSRLDTEKITFSTEKNCWPMKDLENEYPDTETPYKYLNSGLYFAPRDKFLALFDWDMPGYLTDDQFWATTQFLFNPNSGIVLDYGCQAFQSYSFIEDGEFGYGKRRLKNYNTNSMPCMVHGNGTTDMRKIYELIEIV